MWKYYQCSSSSPLKTLCEVTNFKVKCPSAPFTILLFSQTDRREAAKGLEEKDVRIMKRPNTSGLIQPSRNRKTVLQLRGGPRTQPLLVSADPSHSDSRWHCSVGSTRWLFYLHSVSFVLPCTYWRGRKIYWKHCRWLKRRYERDQCVNETPFLGFSSGMP